MERATAPGQRKDSNSRPVRGGRRDQGHHIGQNEPRRRWDLNAIAAAAVTLGMPPAELLDDTLYDIVNNDDTNTNEGKGASLVAALTSTLLARTSPAGATR